METFLSSLSALTGWLVKVSGQASLVIGLVLLAQWLGRKHLPPRVRYALWLLVVARLLLPVSLESGFSIFNLATVTPAEVFRAVGAAARTSVVKTGTKNASAPAAPASPAPAPTMAAGSSVAAVSSTSTAAPKPALSNVTNMGGTPMPRGTGVSPVGSWPWAATLSLVWLAGVAFLLARIIWIPLRLNAQLARHETATSPNVFAVLEDAKRLSGVNRVLPIVQSRAVESPALLGFIRPWLLLPEGLVEKFTPQELRLVFLHELAHLKRRDIAINWLATLLQILHWPNPLVWFAFARMRADRELACDELALSFARAEENKPYGRAIIKLLEGFARPAALPGLVGILEDQTQMKKRITMISQFKQMTRWSAAAAGLLVVLGAVTLTDAQSEPTFATPDSPGMTTRRVLADAAQAKGFMSADGRYISHLDLDTGDVIQFDVASGQTSRIANRGPWSEADKSYEHLAFSRDGTQIAYDIATWDYELRIRNLDGTGLRTLYALRGAYFDSMDWSPDASSLLVIYWGQLALISTADGSVRKLESKVEPWFWHVASYSPDGRSIAFSSWGEGSPSHFDVVLMTADGRNKVVIAGHPAQDHLVRWAPDGRSLIFLSDRSGTWDLWSVPVAEGRQQGEPRLLKQDFGIESEVLGFTPAGSLYYRTETPLGGLYQGAVNLETGRLLDPPARVTTRFTGQPRELSWSPDGTNLAYLSRGGRYGPGNNIPTIRSAATGAERLLSPRLPWIVQISWAPDGGSILGNGWAEKDRGIWRIDAETSAVTKWPDFGRAPKLCPDGKTLVFSVGGKKICQRNLDTGRQSTVVDAELPGLQVWDLSPDGREVVFQVGGVVKVVSLDGGEPRELVRGLAKGYQLRWTRDSRYIIVQARETASSEIWRIPAQGGTPLKLEISVPKLVFFALHPDNRRFVYSVDEGAKSELWVLENFLPKEKLAAK